MKNATRKKAHRKQTNTSAGLMLPREKESTPPELFLDTLARKKVYERMTDLGFMC